MSRENQRRQSKLLWIALIVILIVAAATAGFFLIDQWRRNKGFFIESIEPEDDLGPKSKEAGASFATPSQSVRDEVTQVLSQAGSLAAGYDYEGAIALLSQFPDFENEPAIAKAVAGYEEAKSTLVKAEITEITHVFFHSLIVDTDKAFGVADLRQRDGYNKMMTTKDEFLKMMQAMYDRGFVLVSLHDMAREEVGEDGKPHMVPGEIWLPQGKKPFVLSEDDVCYYEYMDGAGFASRIVIGEDGKPTCEMKLDDGSVVTGGFDVVPLLNDFIAEHPDFSYKGAKGVLAFTGYDGILGYRTAPKYSANPTYEEDKKAAAEVAQCLRDDGWELASHSWGHRDMGNIPYEDFKTDTDTWEAEVESLIGPTDIILFPFGSDIGDWKPYDDTNSRFQYLKSAGFRYFCNVDGSQIHWVQLGDDHLRQGRRNLDGYRMFHHPEKLADLFDVDQVFDPSRPLPVPPMKE